MGTIRVKTVQDTGHISQGQDFDSSHQSPQQYYFTRRSPTIHAENHIAGSLAELKKRGVLPRDNRMDIDELVEPERDECI